jgi:uncharacterized protein GlcG (DUF336 family)
MADQSPSQLERARSVDVVSTPRLTLDGADRLITAARTEAASLGVDVVVHVCDPGGHPIAMVRMDASPTFSIEIARKKAWTAAASGAATASLAKDFMSEPTLLHGVAGNVDELITVGGGVPVRVEGRVAGAIGVSGATEDQDHQIADAAVAFVFG